MISVMFVTLLFELVSDVAVFKRCANKNCRRLCFVAIRLIVIDVL